MRRSGLLLVLVLVLVFISFASSIFIRNLFQMSVFTPRRNQQDLQHVMNPGGWTIVCLSDTHAQLHKMSSDIPAGDILIHAGDFSRKGEKKELQQFYQAFNDLPHPIKLFIAGNHEITLDKEHFLHKGDGLRSYFKPGSNMTAENYHAICRNILMPPNARANSPHYLQDESFFINTNLPDENDEILPDRNQQLKVYGSPWQPRHYTMAFNLNRGAQLAEKWRKIPSDVDLLITHTPPHLILDESNSGIKCGCEALTRFFRDGIISPRLHIFGHIREQHGNCCCLIIFFPFCNVII